MFLLLYFILRSVVAYLTVIVAMRCVIVSINHYLAIYVSVDTVEPAPAQHRQDAGPMTITSTATGCPEDGTDYVTPTTPTVRNLGIYRHVYADPCFHFPKPCPTTSLYYASCAVFVCQCHQRYLQSLIVSVV